MNPDICRIAVIGAGPKGLYCLERLSAELAGSRAALILHIHIFEPHPTPGAGPVYDPAQPPYLRLNFANENIDAWDRRGRVAPVPLRRNFLDFLAADHRDHAEPTGYAPRAFVGEYLAEVFSAVVASLRERAVVTIHHEAVQSVTAVDGKFEISTAARTVRCDEALVATGHCSRAARSHDGQPGRSLGPYPIDRPGGVGDISPGGIVALRGMGLTSIDVVLALTEGRGGLFEPVVGGAGRLRYRGTSRSPRLILPFSRTGRPMVPKDDPTNGPVSTGIDHVILEVTDYITSLSGEPGLVLAELERCLAETAALALAAASGRADGGAGCMASHINDLLQRRPITSSDSTEEFVRSVDVAYGRAEPGHDWAIGTAWKRLYPAIVGLFATRRLDTSWSRFGRLAAEMERLAFGPPAENAARILALVEAGVVDLSLAGGSTLSQQPNGFALERHDRVQSVDELVDAVLAPPGVGSTPSCVMASLLDSGMARAMPGAGGLQVLADGTCVGRSGSPTAGLSAIGRPTEGCVLGNDTLSRTLHDTPSLWASSAVRRLAQRGQMVSQ